MAGFQAPSLAGFERPLTPVGAWLRHGKTHAANGSVEALREIITRLRQHWPGVMILVRGDNGLASPAMYEYCKREGLFYAFGYAANTVLKRRVASSLEQVEFLWWLHGEPWQLFESYEDYQAESWSRPRRVLAKAEVTATGQTNRRFLVTNLSGEAQGLYSGFYVKRGNVPERPIGELKNGLELDRLSSHRFFANWYKLQVHVLAYLLWALFREANAATPELARAEIGAARLRVFKVGALVNTSHRRIYFRIASHWPGRETFLAACQAVQDFVATLRDTPARLWPQSVSAQTEGSPILPGMVPALLK